MNLDEAAFNKQFNSHRLQQLDNNIYFGSLPSLGDLETLRNNNIRFFIGVDIPTETMAHVYTQSNLINLYSPQGMQDIVMINFDTSIVPREIDSNDPTVPVYIKNNTMMLNQLVGHLDPEIFITKQTIYGEKRNYNHLKSNVFQLNNYTMFEQFNDWVEIFKSTTNGVLIFGDHENSETLISLLMSCVIKKSSSLKLVDAFQFVKSLKNDSNDNIQEQNIYWNSGLLMYYEAIRKYSMSWSINKKPLSTTSFFNNNNISPNKKRAANLPPPMAMAMPMTPTSPTKNMLVSTGAFDRCKRARSD
ncbi:hypothetical protein MOSE0_L01068 [Monosporozyma servazzii]